MARLRTRAKRSLLLAVAIAILALLLEMNRFLPGTWQGGDGGGMRYSSQQGPRRAEDAAERKEPDTREHADALVPPDTVPPDWPPKLGMRIELRGPNGDLQTGWRLGIGQGGDESGRPDDDGTLRLRDRRLHTEGFRVRTKDGLLRHRQGVNDPAGRWAVYLPGAALPRQRQPGAVAVTVVDAATAAPLPDAQILWRSGAQDRDASADDGGVVRVRGAQRGGPFQVRVTAPGHAEKQVWIGPRDPRPVPVALDRLVDLKLQVVGAGGETPAVVDGYVLAADGRELARFRGDTPTVRLRETEIPDAWLELRVVVDPEQRVSFTFRQPLDRDRTTVRVPGSRMLSVSLRDPNGAPVGRARVRTIFGAEAGSHIEVEPRSRPPVLAHTKADGIALVAVPADSPFALLVEPSAGAPIARRFAAGDGNAPQELITGPGLHVPVQVRDAAGAPLAGALVVARASVDGQRVLRRATTGTDGRAAVGPLGAGPVELFAGAVGHAWAAVVETASGAMGTVALQLPRGHPLSLVLEDAFGLPLEGVRVEVSPADGGRPLTAPPGGRPWRTDARGRLVVRDLPERVYDVTLTLPGYGVEKLRKVRPGSVTYFGTLVRKR